MSGTEEKQSLLWHSYACFIWNKWQNKLNISEKKGKTVLSFYIFFSNPKSLQPWAVPVRSPVQLGIQVFLWNCWCNGLYRWNTCKPWTGHEKESPWSSLHWFRFQQTGLQTRLILNMSRNQALCQKYLGSSRDVDIKVTLLLHWMCWKLINQTI